MKGRQTLIQNDYKKAVAREAIQYIKNVDVIGIGTGSTVNYFIDLLAERKNQIEGVVSSSIATEHRLRERNIPIMDLNSVSNLQIYIDGADEFNDHFYLTKGGGGALTREKIIATVAQQFVCIVDESKEVNLLGNFPLPIEVIPMARSFVAREMVVKFKGDPVYREGFVTDNGNVILDVHNLNIIDPVKLERMINNIPGVVANGLFACRPADVIIVGGHNGVRFLKNSI